MSNSIEREIERVAARALRDSAGLAGGAPLGIMDGIEAFFTAIDFTEPFIIGVIGTHVTFLMLAVLTRRHSAMQIALLALARQYTTTTTTRCYDAV